MPTTTRADGVVVDDIDGIALWEEAIHILKAAQDCLRVLQEKGVLRLLPVAK